MEILIASAIVALITVVPVMIAAKLLKANNTGFFSCLFAVLVSFGASFLAAMYIDNTTVLTLAQIAITVVVFAMFLNAHYVQSALIALLAYIVQKGMIIAVVGAGLMATA